MKKDNKGISDIEELTELVIKFRDERDWKQFHNPKDLALSLTLEATEVLEHFQWKNPEEVNKYIKTNKADLEDEIADVFKYLLIISNELGIDIKKATLKKMKKDNKNYPVKKSRGKHTKYNKL